ISGNVNSLAPDIFTTGTVNANFSAVGSAAGITTFNADATTNTLLGANLFLGALSNNGGPTQTHLPGGTSPVRDAGSNIANLTTDQRGQPRLLNSGVDIGSVESVGGIPSASGTFTDVSTSGGVSYPLSIKYVDETAVKYATLDNFDIRI